MTKIINLYGVTIACATLAGPAELKLWVTPVVMAGATDALDEMNQQIRAHPNNTVMSDNDQSLDLSAWATAPFGEGEQRKSLLSLRVEKTTGRWPTVTCPILLGNLVRMMAQQGRLVMEQALPVDNPMPAVRAA